MFWWLMLVWTLGVIVGAASVAAMWSFWWEHEKQQPYWMEESTWTEDDLA